MGPWPSKFLQAFIRKRTNPEMFGETDDIRKNIFHRLGKLYALLVWTMFGLLLHYFYKTPEPVSDEESRPKLPNQKEIDEGGAFFYMTKLRTSEEVGDKEQLVYRVKGFSVEKENVTEKVRETITAQEE